MAVRKTPQQKLVIDPRTPGEPGTIGWIFDFYRSRGNKLPDNATINSNNFKSRKNEREQN